MFKLRLEQGLPLGAKLKHSKLWRPCSIHILKTPLFLTQSTPSENFWGDGADSAQEVDTLADRRVSSTPGKRLVKVIGIHPLLCDMRNYKFM